jgi:glycerophosphoryl diester phosphodiesterase
MQKKILLIGHRGARFDYDENTLEAFEIAFNYGADLIECDVRQSKDGELVIIHDDSIDRTTNGSGYINSYNYSELKKFKTINRESFIPLLINLFELFESKWVCMLEIKEEGIREKLVQLIKRYNINNKIIISGRNHNLLVDIKQDLQGCRVCYNITKGNSLNLKEFISEDFIKSIQSLDMISLKSNQMDLKFIDKCHKYGIKALTWNFTNYYNPISKIKEMIGLGIDGILFDNYKNIRLIRNWLIN